MQALVSEQVESFRRKMPARNVELTHDGSADLVDAQPTLIALVIENLINNAAKYSPADTPIEVTLRADKQNEIEVRVRDQGIGVNESELSNLFTPFYRTAAAKGYATGMGLGLAVCKRIVEAHRGRIWANRRPEGGSDFILALPRIDQDRDD
jgi:two-component system sensor histidine kinase KdpD